MLLQAANFLDDPDLFYLDVQDLADYRFNSRENELRESMLKLESLALANGAKSGFWRRIKKVAEQLKNAEKADEYEKRFHEALSKKST